MQGSFHLSFLKKSHPHKKKWRICLLQLPIFWICSVYLYGAWCVQHILLDHKIPFQYFLPLEWLALGGGRGTTKFSAQKDISKPADEIWHSIAWKTCLLCLCTQWLTMEHQPPPPMATCRNCILHMLRSTLYSCHPEHLQSECTRKHNIWNFIWRGQH